MIKKVVSTLDRIEDACLVLMFVVMVGAIFLQVIMRYVFNNSLVWSEELGKFIFVWLSWIGISIGHRRREHIRIGLLVDKFPYKIKKGVEAFTELVLIVICGITLYYGIVMMGIQVNVPYAGIKISTSYGYLSIVLGCGLMILRASAFFVSDLKSVFQPSERGQ